MVGNSHDSCPNGDVPRICSHVFHMHRVNVFANWYLYTHLSMYMSTVVHMLSNTGILFFACQLY